LKTFGARATANVVAPGKVPDAPPSAEAPLGPAISVLDSRYAPAIVVPYRNRARHLGVLLSRLPPYLKSQGIRRYEIVISEQTDDGQFGIATSRNVGAAYALRNTRCDYFIFNDVDVVPHKNVDYRRPNENAMYFMNGGSCKVLRDALVASNGYNNEFLGWGCEDQEFWRRLIALGFPSYAWHTSPEARGAEILDLEFAWLSDAELEARSKAYFGWTDAGPRFVSGGGAFRGIAPTDKRGFYEPPITSRNHRLFDWIQRLPPDMAREYFGIFGMNQINLARVTVDRSAPHVTWLRYDRREVLEP
jgi:hypothetical protein